MGHSTQLPDLGPPRTPFPLSAHPFPALLLSAALLGACQSAAPPEPPPQPPRGPAPVAEVGEPTQPAATSPLEASWRELNESITLDQAIATALERNPDQLAAVERIRQAEASLQLARSAFHPTLGVDVDYLRGDAPSQYLFKTIDAGALAPNTDFNDPGPFTSWEAGLTLRYNLWNGGRDANQREISQADVDLRALERSIARNALVAAVIEAWFEVRAAAELVLTAQASEETVRAQLRDARARYQSGQVLKSDVLSLEVRAAEASELTIRAENGRALALAALATLLGLSPDAQLVLLDDDSQLVRSPVSYDQALAIALVERPELARARRQVEQAQLGLDQAQAAIAPSLDLMARWYANTTGLDFEQSRDNWLLGVGLSWAAYDGGRRGAGTEGTRARLEELRRADHKALLAVHLDVKSAWLRNEEARARLEVAASAVEQAEETLELVRRQYEGGSAPVTRYLEAELMATEARMRRTAAAFDVKRAEAGLARATGQFGQHDGYAELGGIDERGGEAPPEVQR